MLVYWILFLIPAFAALVTGTKFRRDRYGRARLTPLWIAVFLFLVVLVGLRHQVGGDWYNYLGHLNEARGESLGYLVTQSDPGYRVLNWLAVQFGWGIYGVNTMGAVVFVFGLLAFCRGMPRPWLALAVSMPYLVIVVAMGYTRQGIALGLAMVGLQALERGSVRGFALWTLAGATFHRSAVLLLPVAALAATRKRIWSALWIGAIGLVGYQALLERDVDSLYTNYIQNGYESQGALIRLGMNAVAAVIFLRFQSRFGLPKASAALWRWISILAVALFAAFFLAPSASTALDRLGLYLLPLQVLVFTHLPGILGNPRTRKLLVLAVLFYYAAILMVWLVYANNAFAWRPYSNWIWADV